MFETTMTLVGNVASDVNVRTTENGHSLCRFRVASTSRRYDAGRGQFVNGDTLFLSVTCWRGLAENVGRSVVKGDPVIVTGRLRCREYEKDESKRVDYEIDATSEGLDLARGTAEFRRTPRTHTASAAVGPDGVPANDGDQWLGLASAPAPAAAAPRADRELVGTAR